MPKESDLEGLDDQGGKHRPQAEPKPQPFPDEHVDDEDGDICSPRHEPSTDDDAPLP